MVSWDLLLDDRIANSSSQLPTQKRELFCLQYGSSQWCHVIKHDKVGYTVRRTPRDLWEQLAHVDPTSANSTVSDYTRRNARAMQSNVWTGSVFTTEE